MKSAPWILAVGAVTLTPVFAQSTAGVPPTAASPAASAKAGGGTGADLGTAVVLYRQIDGLSLTTAQKLDIRTRLRAVAAEEARFRAAEATALATAADSTQRVQDAMFRGVPINPADLAQVNAVLASLDPARTTLQTLQRTTVAAIYRELTPDQVTVIRKDVAMDRAPQPTTPAGTGLAGAGGTAGAGLGAVGAGGAPGGGAGAAGGQQPGGRRGTRAMTPDQYVGRMLDRVRSLPANRWNRAKSQIAAGFAARTGADPNSPNFQQVQNDYLQQFTQLRSVPDDQFKGSRDQIVTNMAARLPNEPVTFGGRGRRGNGAGGPGGANGGGPAGGVTGAAGGPGGGGFDRFSPTANADQDAIRRFFLLQPEALHYLDQTAPHTAK